MYYSLFINMSMSENRIIELETKLTYQDKAIEDLSETVFRLDQKLEQLQRVCDSLKQKIIAINELTGLEVDEHDQKPPHY